jgi:glycine betaine catabolism A
MTAKSPRLDHCPRGLPAKSYWDPSWYARETNTVLARNWVCVGRLDDFGAGLMHRIQVGQASVLFCRGSDGIVSAFHNVCRHRGSELCSVPSQPLGKLIICPYHAFAYATTDGRLVATGHAHPTPDFLPEGHGLFPVAISLWNGFVFLNTARSPAPLQADVSLDALDNWPTEGLVTGHRWTKDIACNWKVFWENYSECLHCPGVHPELCDMVPVYRKGIMAPAEAADWIEDQPAQPNLKPGAESWTLSGQACGPHFPRLTAAEASAGFTFVTFWPTLYVVAHVDYVRSVRITPLGPELTRLTAEWHFAPETLAQPGFDAASVADFAKMVLEQDGAAAEMNQRGLHSPAYERGTLMPEEYEIHRFHTWILNEMEVSP